jgi:protein DJ-1
VAPDSSAEPDKTVPSIATCSRGLQIVPDSYLRPLDFGPDKYDLLVIPGGAQGAETISGNSPVQHLVREYIKAGKIVGMICAGKQASCGSAYTLNVLIETEHRR